MKGKGSCFEFSCSQNWDEYACPSGDCTLAVPLSLGAPLQSNMVLQRNAGNQIWGVASSGAAVSVTVTGPAGSEQQTTTAAANGTWSVLLRPRPAVAAGSNITVTTSDGHIASIANVVFGDVYLCGG
jgi:sialate O-acetylesterase